MKGKAKRAIQHAVTLALIGASIAFAVLYFGQAIFFRYGQAFGDLVRSVIYYFVFLFTGREDVIAQTVQLFPAEMETLLPLSYEEFKVLFELFFELFFSKAVFLLWVEQTMEIVGDIAYYASLFALPALLLVMVLVLMYRGTDTEHNKDTKALATFKRFRNGIPRKLWRAIKAQYRFIKSRTGYALALVMIWTYNLNFLTILLEAVAFVFYLGPCAGWGNIFVQIAKFVVDFSVAGFFIPFPIWIAIGYYFFHLWRCRLGKKKLEAVLKKFEEFIKRYPGALFITGRQRSKKTTLLTMFKLMYERIFRARAKKNLFKWKKRFPFFPWINVELFVTRARKRRKLFMLYHCRRFVAHLKEAYYMPEGKAKVIKIRQIRKMYGYHYKNLLFDHDVEEGSLTYQSELEPMDIFKAIETYMQLFWIYSQRTPLDYSNYSIREDFKFKNYGNFPVFDGDLIKRTAKESFAASQYSYIIDYDSFRPGVKFDEENENKDAVEYGIRTTEEYAKERKNKQTRRSEKGKEEAFATQDNDGYELDNKVRGQVALVDYDDYFVSLFDDQRAGSLGADNKDLATNGYIKGAAEEVFLLPFFEIEEALFRGLSKIYDKVYEFLHSRKGSNTLAMYLLDLFFAPIFKAWERVHDRFTGWRVRLSMKDCGDEEALGVEELIVLGIAAYRSRYASDSCKSFYEFRFARSRRGMEDFEQYDDIHVKRAQREKQKSYFSEDMLIQNGVKTARKPRRKK